MSMMLAEGGQGDDQRAAEARHVWRAVAQDHVGASLHFYPFEGAQEGHGRQPADVSAPPPPPSHGV